MKPKAKAKKSATPRDNRDRRDNRPASPSPQACRGLAFTAAKALGTLAELAGTGNALAAAVYLETLRESVKSFEHLASERPELFRATARQCFGIPALASRNAEKQAGNQQLAAKLEEGEDFHLSIVPKGGRHWKFTAANALAARLVKEISQGLFSYVTNPKGYAPDDWQASAVKLEPFSAKTWRDWAGVAWKILDGGKAPELYAKETRICSPSSRDGGPERVWPGDVKKALFDAFRTIATGTARRGK